MKLDAEQAALDVEAARLDQEVFSKGQETAQVQMNLQQIRTALRNSPEFLLQFFLGEQLTAPVPDFHQEVFREMTLDEVTRLLILIPRGHAKTTLAKLACVWYLIFSRYRFVLYVSGSHDLVVPYVQDIAGFFDTENFIAVFGKVNWKIRQDGVGVYKFVIPATGKTCILRGLGAGQRIRGINVDNDRPQLAICDDIEDDEDVESEELHKKKLRWFYGPFIKCLNPFDNKIVACGNLLGARSIMYKLWKSPRWHSFFYAILRENFQPLWPDVWPVEKIKEDFREYQDMGLTAKWFAEMMNCPVPEGGGVIKADEINYKPARLPKEVKYGFITVDPAVSQQNWADRRAIVAHGWIEEEQQWQIVETIHNRNMDPTQLFFAAAELAERWGFYVIGVEADAMQKVLQYYFDHLKYLHNKVYLEFVPLHSGNVKKTARVATWAAAVKKNPAGKSEYALTEGDFAITQQLIMYQPMHKDNDDDIIDACAYGLQMIRLYLHMVLNTVQKLPQGGIQTLQQVAGI